MKNETRSGAIHRFTLFCLFGCLLAIITTVSADAATTTPLRHTVRPGQTLYSIARSYGVPLDGLAAANGIRNPASLRAGTRLVIPSGGTSVAPARQRTTAARTTTRRARHPAVRRPAAPAIPLDDADETGAGSADIPARLSPAMSPAVADIPGRFDALPWPVAGRVISGFDRPRRGHRHQGIDIGSEAGAPIHPVAEGTVVLVEEHYGNYGRLIAIEHDNGMVSYYGHNMKNLVSLGDRVTTDGVIALVGHSGNASCNHLHFEIRSNGAAIDPTTALTPQP
ncbi:MAG TPA: M23 family metallopeptidase [Patescibacteria group bacterium]|nr:M23 family metallopeptidase [Patescibacteria group bacterium]